MNSRFNPLESRLLFKWPQWLHQESAWTEHVPFAMLLIELQRPRTLVELGTHRGISYCAFCQAVKELDYATKCHAVDTWSGDVHAGFYDNQIYENLKKHHQQYESFSRLMRMTFDEALEQIPDHSVDLLHIDGLHTYEAVKHDFETWFPKLSDRGIVLFHDTMVMERNFGVHQLWRELMPQFPHFNFEHGFGLGVLAVGKNQPETISDFLCAADEQSAPMRELFSSLGRRLQWPYLSEEMKQLKKLQSIHNRSWKQKMLAPARWLKHSLVKRPNSLL